MSENSKTTLRWVAIPGVKRPNFVFNKVSIGIPTSIPSNLIFALVFISILYVYIGGVFDLVEDPHAFGATENQQVRIFYPSQDRQFLLEGIVAGLVMMMGALGLYLIYQATKDPHDTSRATTYQTFGIILIVIAYFALQMMYSCKLDANKCT